MVGKEGKASRSSIAMDYCAICVISAHINLIDTRKMTGGERGGVPWPRCSLAGQSHSNREGA